MKFGILIAMGLGFSADWATESREALRRYPRYKYLHTYKAYIHTLYIHIYTHLGRRLSREIKVLTGYKECKYAFYYPLLYLHHETPHISISNTQFCFVLYFTNLKTTRENGKKWL